MLVNAGGDLKVLELQIKKRIEKVSTDKLAGGWVTEIDLQGRGWTQAMIDHSKAWAEERGLLSTSAIHGAEEWKLPLDKTFEMSNSSFETAGYSGNTQVEVWLMQWRVDVPGRTLLGRRSVWISQHPLCLGTLICRRYPVTAVPPGLKMKERPQGVLWQRARAAKRRPSLSL